MHFKVSHKAIANIFYISVLNVLLSSCANGGSGIFLETTVAPDERLSPSGKGLEAIDTSLKTECPVSILTQFPEGFSPELCYPDALLLDIERLGAPSPQKDYPNPETQTGALKQGERMQTQWSTTQSIETVQQFYQDFFDEKEWNVTRLPNELDKAGIFQAVKGESRITIRFSNFSQLSESQQSANTSDLITISKVQPIQYTLEYRKTFALEAYAGSEDDRSNNPPDAINQPLNVNASRGDGEAATRTDGKTDTHADADAETDTNVETEAEAETNTSSSTSTKTEIPSRTRTIAEEEIEDIPPEIRAYVNAFIELEIDRDRENPQAIASFRPTEPITRREFARWLFKTNNLIYGNSPSKHIRLASETSAPAFSDVPSTDPDFEIIQGLAEAGLIASNLSTGAQDISFRADAPLVREVLIDWKTPLDSQGALPSATIEDIKASWGFRDADSITSSARNAILADHSNGDNANIRRAFGYTLLFQPQKAVTRAEAAAALGYFGSPDDGTSLQEILQNQTSSEPE